MTRHGHVDKVVVAEVDFGNRASSLHDNGVVLLREAVEGSADFLAEVNRLSGGNRQSGRCGGGWGFAPEIVGIAVAYGDAIEHHLAGVVTLRFQEKWVHVGVTRNASSLCLYSLGTANLQTFGSGVGVQCHVLRLEGSGMIAILQEYTAQGCGKDALAHITASSCQHDWMKSSHNDAKVKKNKKMGK